MAFWTSGFMNKMRQHWMRKIAKIQYYDGSKWRDAIITDKRISGDTIEIKSQTNDNAAMTIKRVRLVDDDGMVAGETSESITKLSTQGVITLWKFPIYEITT